MRFFERMVDQRYFLVVDVHIFQVFFVLSCSVIEPPCRFPYIAPWAVFHGMFYTTHEHCPISSFCFMLEKILETLFGGRGAIFISGAYFWICFATASVKFGTYVMPAYIFFLDVGWTAGVIVVSIIVELAFGGGGGESKFEMSAIVAVSLISDMLTSVDKFFGQFLRKIVFLQNPFDGLSVFLMER